MIKRSETVPFLAEPWGLAGNCSGCGHVTIWVKHYGKNYGTVFTAYGIGAIAGVLLSGFFKDIFHGYRQVFYLIIVLSLTGIGTAVRFQKSVHPLK